MQTLLLFKLSKRDITIVPFIYSVAFLNFSYLWSTPSQEANDPPDVPSEGQQQPNATSQCLCPSSSSHHLGMLSSQSSQEG